MIKITGRDRGTILYYIKIGYISDYIKVTQDNIKISKTDFFKILEDKSFNNNSYDSNEISQLLFCSKAAAKNYMKKHFSSDLIRVFGTLYVPKSIIDAFVQDNEYLRHLATGEYVLLKNVIPDLKKNRTYVHKILDSKNNDRVIFNELQGQYYIHKSLIESTVESINIVNNYYTSIEICEQFGCTYSQYTFYIARICEIFKSHTRVCKQHYFAKDEVDNFVSEKRNQGYKNILDFFNKIKQGTSAPTIKKNEMKVNGTTYVSTAVVAQIFSVRRDTVLENIKKGNFKDSLMLVGQYWVSKDEIDEIIAFVKNTVTLKDIGEDILSIKEKRRMMHNGLLHQYFPNAVLFNTFCIGTWRVPYSDIENFKASKMAAIKASEHLKMKANETSIPEELFDILIDECKDTLYTKTLQLFKEFSYIKIQATKSKKIRNFVQRYAKTLKILLESITKEIYLYNDVDLRELLLDNVAFLNDKLNIFSFVSYLKKNYYDICKFNDTYNGYIVGNPRQSEKDVYSYEKWMDYSNFLTNIDKHIVRAFENEMYAKRWLYCLLHLVIAWRAKDILEIGPIDSIENISNYDLQWFEENQFTITQAQYIVNQIKILVQSITANKNGVRTHFIVLPYLVIPTAIAFITAQYHLTKNNITTTSIFHKSRFDINDFKAFFDDEYFWDFSNRKANRTLLTHNFNQAIITPGMADVAYSLSLHLRSHRFSEGFENSDTTAQYIYSTNADGDAANVALHLFRRGTFGWLFNSIVKIATSETELSLEDVTSNIEMLKNEYSPLAIESLSSYLMIEYDERRSVLAELLSEPKEKMWEIIFLLKKCEMSSKTEAIDCLKYNGILHQCPYKYNTSCIGCKYKIPTNYALSIVSVQLDSLIEKLEETNSTDYIHRQKYTFLIVKLLGLIAEAKKEFNKWDKDYVNSFIDIQSLELRIKDLQVNKFLMLAE